MDVMPTLLDLAGTTHPGTRYRDREIRPLQGASMAPMLRGEAETVHEAEHVMGWELFDKRAIRRGDWKLVWTPEPFGPREWQLYDLATDPSELDDRSDELPEVREELLALWERYAQENGVILAGYPGPY
jgi:arylsulfatase